MKSKLLSWWQEIKQRQIAIGITLLVLVVVIALAFAIETFGWDWLGISASYSKITITSTTKGITIAKELQPAKTLWDVLQLLGVLAIPVVVGLGTVWFTTQQGKASDTENKDNQREAALQTYIDKMSKLLLKKNLGNTNETPNTEAQKLARVRTMTVLRNLDDARKASILLFLYEADLIHRDIYDGIIDLRGADFSHADLGIANLSSDFQEGTTRVSKSWLKQHGLYGNLCKAKLNGVTLKEARLPGANLNEADLSDTYLSRADLTEADLIGANLQGARLRKTILEKADLTSADLTDANLLYANLKNAKLYGAKLCGADLREADLRGTNLSTANLNGAKLHDAKYNKNKMQEKDAQGKPDTIAPTQWPQGFDPDAAGAVCVDC